MMKKTVTFAALGSALLFVAATALPASAAIKCQGATSGTQPQEDGFPRPIVKIIWLPR